MINEREENLLAAIKYISKTFSVLSLDKEEDVSKLSCEITKETEELKLIDSCLEENDTKIFVIGENSCGKSTLINTLLKRDVFSTTVGHGTTSFFICRKTDKDYEYFTINNGVEIRDMEMLKKSTRVNNESKGYIGQSSIIRVYINVGEDSILNKRTTIVDCPGLGFSNAYDTAIEDYCKHADLVLFMFDVRKGATKREMDLIDRFKKTSKKPTCLHIYNKCDMLQNISIDVPKLKEKFKRDFPSFDESNLKRGQGSFMISAKMGNEIARNEILSEEFRQFKNVLNDHRDIDYIRLENLWGQKIEQLRKLKQNLLNFEKIVTESRERLSEFLTWLKVQVDETNEEDVVVHALKGNVEKVVFDTIKGFTGKCNKLNHDTYLADLSKEVNSNISEKIKSVIKTERLPAASRALTGTTDFLGNFEVKLNIIVNYFETNLEIRYGYMDAWFSRETTNTVQTQFLEYVKGKMPSILTAAANHFQTELKNGINLKMYVTRLNKALEQLKECRKLVDDMLPNQ